MQNYISVLLSMVMVFALSTAGSETLIIDDQSGSFLLSGAWQEGSSAGYHVTGYQYALTVSGSATHLATWSPEFNSAGTFEVAVWYLEGTNRPTDAEYTIHHSGGATTVKVDQTVNGSQWHVIGTYNFPATGGSVVLSNHSSAADKAVIADAVRFVRSGTTYDNLYQGMWIQSWNQSFHSESQTNAMIGCARENNMNIIFPEVRKVGDAYYQSATEPFADNVASGYDDPLGDVLAKAHDTSDDKQYIEVHAWLVPYRVWRDSLGTPPDGHVLIEHPDWKGQTNTGSQSDGSIYIDPGVPAVQDYLIDVVEEIVLNYDVDGIHFDYYRYPGTSWGYNPVAIQRFNTLYGRTGIPSTSDPDFCDFRRDQIRQFGRRVYAAVKAIDWNCKVSAATIQWGSCPADFTKSSAYASVFQDWVGFMQEGLLDMNVLMNYKREYYSGQAQDYRDWAHKLADTCAGRHAVNGPGVYLNYIQDSVTQTLYALDIPDIVGTNFYEYKATNRNNEFPATDFWYTMRADCYTQRRDVPPADWIDTPTQGILRGKVTYGSTPIDGATITLSNGVSGSITTDGCGWYAFLKLDEGANYHATASFTGYDNQTLAFDITAGEVARLDFDFAQTPTPTPTPTPTVTPTETPTPTPSPTPSFTPTPSPTPTPTPIHTYSFESGNEGWQFHGYIADYDIATSSCQGGYLGLSPFYSSYCFSYWSSPYLSIEDEKLYRARWLMGSTCSNADDSVQFRLRVNQTGSWQGWNRIVSSFNQQSCCISRAKWYDLFFNPAVSGEDGDAVVLNFDVMSFEWTDDCSSWLMLQEVIVDEVSLQTGAQLEHYEFMDDSDGWIFVGDVSSYDSPMTVNETSHLGLSPDGSINCFGYWYSPDVPIEAERMYRARFEMASSVSEPDDAVQFRLRVNQKGSWQGWERVVPSFFKQSPTSLEPKSYDILFAPCVTGADEGIVVLSCDILNFDPTDNENSWLYLESASFDQMTLVP